MFNEIHRIFQFSSSSFSSVSVDLFISFHMFENFLWKAKARRKIYWEFYFNSYLQAWLEKKNRSKKRREFQSIFDSFDKHYKSQIIKEACMYTIARNWEHKRDFLEKFAMPKLSEISRVCCLWSWGLFAITWSGHV